MRKIVKAEILITRRCNLNCFYCGMKRKRPERDAAFWREAFRRIKALGATFVPIYGAEPLVYPQLVEVVSAAVEVGLDHTVISNSTLLSEDLAKRLMDAGLESWTVSLDFPEVRLHPPSTRKRARAALQALDIFGILGLRDLEVVMTLSRSNLVYAPDMVLRNSFRGIWTSFDVLHHDRGMSWSKCAPKEVMKGELFTEQDADKLAFVGEVLASMVPKALIHQPSRYFDMFKEGYPYRLNWHCLRSFEKFSSPGWITVDCDGSLIVCDDLDMPTGFSILDLPEKWDEYMEVWQQIVRNCPGCFWSTHWMSGEMLERQMMDELLAHRATWGDVRSRLGKEVALSDV